MSERAPARSRRAVGLGLAIGAAIAVSAGLAFLDRPPAQPPAVAKGEPPAPAGQAARSTPGRSAQAPAAPAKVATEVPARPSPASVAHGLPSSFQVRFKAGLDDREVLAFHQTHGTRPLGAREEDGDQRIELPVGAQPQRTLAAIQSDRRVLEVSFVPDRPGPPLARELD